MPEHELEDASGVIPEKPKNPDKWYIRLFKPRTYSRIADGRESPKFLSAEPSLERVGDMLDAAVKEMRRAYSSEKPLKVDLRILSVLDKGTDKKKLENITVMRAYFLATYSNDPRFAGVELQLESTEFSRQI